MRTTPQIRNEMRAYKAKGHTMVEVAQKFNVSKTTARKVCKGIAPQQNINGSTGQKGVLQCDENIKRIISERAPGFEYAGNYTGSEGHVDLRCKECGYVFTARWNAIRHKGHKVCPACEQKKKRALAVKKETEKQAHLVAVEYERKCKKRGAQVVKLLKHAERIHRCPVCGTITDKKKYCSEDCARKAWNANHEAKRRAKIKSAIVDKDITTERLYERDGGICAICGKPCDWSDSRWEDGVFIIGNNYPTKDHIIPLAKGGEHSWENVQLAHHHCNSVKGARWDG